MARILRSFLHIGRLRSRSAQSLLRWHKRHGTCRRAQSVSTFQGLHSRWFGDRGANCEREEIRERRTVVRRERRWRFIVGVEPGTREAECQEQGGRAGAARRAWARGALGRTV